MQFAGASFGLYMESLRFAVGKNLVGITQQFVVQVFILVQLIQVVGYAWYSAAMRSQ